MIKTGRKTEKLKKLDSIPVFVILCMLFFFTGISWSADISAQVDKRQITMQDSVFLNVILKGGKTQLDTSPIKDFRVIPKGTSSSYQYINGKAENKTIYQYLLIPLSKGKLIVPPITAQVDGKVLKTNPISIDVLENVVDPDSVKSLFSQASISESQLFAGQQAIYSVKLFFSKQLAGLGFEKRPGFNGLTAKAFGNEKKYSLKIDGKLYNVIQVDFLVTASSPGEYTIDPASFIAKERIRIRQNPSFDSVFGDSFFSTTNYKPVRVASNAVRLTIAPLPNYKGQSEFSGLVGQFKIQAGLDRTELKVGDSGTLTIDISGTGNIMDASLPDNILEMLAFKIYDDNPVDEISLSENGYQGRRVFKKALVPITEGQYQIDPLELVYFDVVQKKYKTAFSQPIQISVIPSNESSVMADMTSNQTPSTIEKREVTTLNKDILDVKQGIDVLKNEVPLPMHLFLLFLGLPVLLFVCVKGFMVFNLKDRSDHKLMLQKARHHMRMALKTQMDNDSYLSHIYSALIALILSKANKKGETLTQAEAREILTGADIDEKEISHILDLMQTIESIRFGGRKIDEHAARQFVPQLKKMVKMLGCIIGMILILTSTPRLSQADVTSDFTQAMTYYRAEKYLKSAHFFEQVAKTPVRNGYLYYNIGNAYLKSGDLGHSILWYERAKMLIPNEPDLQYNLKYANGLVKDKKEETIDYLELIFFWDKLVGVKTIQYLSIAFSLIFFSWAMVRVLQRNKILSGTGLLLLACLIISTGLAGVDFYRQAYFKTAVIVSDEVDVRSGVGSSATTLFKLHAGTLVKVHEKRNSAMKIEFSKDRVGWVERADAEVVQDFGINYN